MNSCPAWRAVLRAPRRVQNLPAIRGVFIGFFSSEPAVGFTQQAYGMIGTHTNDQRRDCHAF